MRSSLISILFVLPLISCGTVRTVHAPLQATANTSFVLLDRRPQELRATRSPAKQGDKLYLGDDSIFPPAAELFKTVLQQRAGDTLAGKTVVLTDLTVSIEEPVVNVDQGKVTDASFSIPGGPAVAPLAGALIYGIEKIRSNKWVFVGVEGSIDGVAFQASKADTYRGRVSEENVFTTLLAILEMAADEAVKAVGQK